MKIVFLNDDFPPQSFGGAGISVYELALEMKRLGHDVFVITTCRLQQEAGEAEYDGLRVFKIASDYNERWQAYISLYNRPVIHQVEKILGRIKPDVVHINNVHFYLSYHCFKIAKRHARAVVFTARDVMSFSYSKLKTKKYLERGDCRVNWFDQIKQAKKRWNPLRNFFIRRYLSYADKIFAISESLKKALFQNGIRNVDVIYNGIDADAWSVENSAVADFRSKYNLFGKKVLLFSGRLSTPKGGGKVLETLVQIVKEMPETVLLVIGSFDQYAQAMQNRADDLGLEGKMIFTGWMEREDIKIAYAAADIVLMPSICFDAFGRVNIEAMAAKKPVIGTCYGGTPEVVLDSVTGYIVNPIFPEEIARRAMELIEHPLKAKKFGEDGYRRVRDLFVLRDKAKDYVAAYEHILDTNSKVLVVFGEVFPTSLLKRKFNIIIAESALKTAIEKTGSNFVDLNTLVGPGNVYEASNLLEEFSHLRLNDGRRITKLVNYHGYDLWWVHYNNLFNYFCIPFTRYKNLLSFLKRFRSICLYRPPHERVFRGYLRAHSCQVLVSRSLRFKSPLPLGIFIQILLTALFLPILILRQRRLMLFTGDKFEKGFDYDTRMKFVYGELRQKKIMFVEFIRSLEPWKIVLRHAMVRKRPVIYSEAIFFIGRFLSIISGGRALTRRRLLKSGLISVSGVDPENSFKLIAATECLLGSADDIWAIRIMSFILRVLGIKAAFITLTSERNFHSVLGCKLNKISTVGILHGVTSRYSVPHDFLPGFDGNKLLSVDAYGVWSEWWRDYYLKNSQAYKPEQLYISGPMRPLSEIGDPKFLPPAPGSLVRVLFISEQAAEPEEIMPYLNELMKQETVDFTLKFRPYQDGFEEWLKKNRPQFLQRPDVKVVRGSMEESIKNCDVVVGSYSTAALEALLQLKIPIFMFTRKWGDYYNLAESEETCFFLARNPAELIHKINNNYSVNGRLLMKLREQYFGDPYKNGSAWVVDRLESLLIKN